MSAAYHLKIKCRMCRSYYTYFTFNPCQNRYHLSCVFLILKWMHSYGFVSTSILYILAWEMKADEARSEWYTECVLLTMHHKYESTFVLCSAQTPAHHDGYRGLISEAWPQPSCHLRLISIVPGEEWYLIFRGQLCLLKLISCSCFLVQRRITREI